MFIIQSKFSDLQLYTESFFFVNVSGISTLLWSARVFCVLLQVIERVSKMNYLIGNVKNQGLMFTNSLCLISISGYQ